MMTFTWTGVSANGESHLALAVVRYLVERTALCLTLRQKMEHSGQASYLPLAKDSSSKGGGNSRLFVSLKSTPCA
jgi:hypothetical protein